MTDHDVSRMKRALACDCDDEQSLVDALGALQSTDDPSLVPLHDELQDTLRQLKQKKAKRMTDRELATVLAALRLWQDNLEEDGRHIPLELWEIAGHAGTPLTQLEIDKLCEKLNTTPLEWTPEETQAREA